MEGLRDYDAAVRALLSRQGVDFSQRNVLIAHQNVTANGVESIRGGSESMIGGVGQVEYTAFDGFDYVALGHIHAAYAVGRDTVRYAGSPLCYHFDETRQREKGALLVEIGEKGTPVKIETLTIPPLHPMREIRGAFEEILAMESANVTRGEYLRVVLTDCRIDAKKRDALTALFKARDCKLLDFTSDYVREMGTSSAPSSRGVKEKPMEQLFAEFYEERNGGEAPDEAAMVLLGFAGEQLRHADTSVEPTREDVERLLAELMRGEEEA
jgi:exonuclease SbcD